MSFRREAGDIVLVKTDESQFVGQIISPGSEGSDECPMAFVDKAHDCHCREWPNVAILDHAYKETGTYAYHVSECEMENVP